MEQVIRFLNGNYDTILGELEEKMQKASENLNLKRLLNIVNCYQVYKRLRRSRRLQILQGKTGIFLR